MVGIVGGQDHAVALLLQTADRFQHLDLVAVVQMGGGFIHQDEGGALGQGPGDGHLLPLAAGDLAVGAIRKIFDAHAPDGLHGDVVMLLLRPGQGAHVGGTARDHVLQHRKIEAGHDDLGHIADDPRHFPRRHFADVLAV